jgi:hypothetical protein
LSTIYFTFGQVDPTKSLKDLNNFTQTIVRSDVDSINKYSSNQVKNVVSRWIPSTNKAIAQDAAQLLGRRFSDIPREITFSLDAKDNRLNIGDTRAVTHRDTPDATGLPASVIYQITSKQESKNFKYKGVEFIFGEELADDNDLSSDTILISIDEQDLNLRTRYEANIGTPTGSTNAVFKIEQNVIVGSSSTSTPAIDTGSWPVGATVTIINSGFIVGAGGDAGYTGTQAVSEDGGAGGDALSLSYALTLTNYGVVGGGGGGGASDQDGFPATFYYAGGGGAGNTAGLALSNSEPGTLESGGRSKEWKQPEGFIQYLDGGGDLGEAGTANGATAQGGAAGKAIDLNGNTLTYDANSDIRGTVS